MEHVKTIIARLGGPVAVGRALGLTHSAICQWKEIPTKYLVQLELFSEGQVTREEMRPDLFLKPV